MSFQYDQYLERHRSNVKRGFDWLSENLPEITKEATNAGWNAEFAHDKSKDEPDEYEPYDAYFYGNNRSYQVVQDYQKAWLLHIHRNPHHWQHWILINDDPKEGEIVLEMPYDYILEMICDWWSFSMECEHKNDYCLGENDYSLMQRLSNTGTDHRKFMRMLPVYVRITAPLYWWKEFDTYKVGTVANICSTMHKIQAKEFILEDFSCEHLNRIGTSSLWDIIDILNLDRKLYLNGGDYKGEHYAPKDKQVWWQMIQLLPSSYNQTRNVMMNYEVLANIYKSRKDHKLDEWRELCKWIESLPYYELITGGTNEKMA